MFAVAQKALLALIVLLLFSCSVIETHKAGNADLLWQQRQQRLAQLQQWHVEGVIHVRHREQGGTMNIVWSRQQQTDDIALIAPFGKTLLKIRLSPESALVEMEDGKTYQQKDARLLIKDLLGLNVPVNLLKQWIIGQSLAGKTQYDRQGLLRGAEQNGWTLKIADYQWAYSNKLGDFAMPSNLRIDNANSHVSLNLSAWNLNGSQALDAFDDDLPAIPLFEP